MSMDNIIIGIYGGNENTQNYVANMLCYINQVGCTKANMTNYIIASSKSNFTTNKIVSFNDTLYNVIKEILPAVKNISKDELFNSNKYYGINDCYRDTIIDYNDLLRIPNKKILSESDSKISNFDNIVYFIPLITFITNLKWSLCNLMHDDMYFIKKTINTANYVSDIYTISIIKDILVTSEINAILDCKNGYVINLFEHDLKINNNKIYNLNTNTPFKSNIMYNLINIISNAKSNTN